MSKLAEIYDCGECPWRGSGEDAKGFEISVCWNNAGVSLANHFGIPDWCPLPDAPQEGAHCADTPKETSIMEDMAELKGILDTHPNKV